MMPFDPQILELLGMLGLPGFEQILLSPMFRAQLMTQAGGRSLEALGGLAPGLSAMPGTQSVPLAPGGRVPISGEAILALLMGMQNFNQQPASFPPQPSRFQTQPPPGLPGFGLGA